MPKCKSNTIARMDKRVEVQQENSVSDGQGGQATEWVAVATVWARIEPVSGYERMQAMQLAAPRTHKITLRYADWINERMRIVYDNRIFAIKEVINLEEANQFLTLKCLEG